MSRGTVHVEIELHEEDLDYLATLAPNEALYLVGQRFLKIEGAVRLLHVCISPEDRGFRGGCVWEEGKEFVAQRFAQQAQRILPTAPALFDTRPDFLAEDDPSNIPASTPLGSHKHE